MGRPQPPPLEYQYPLCGICGHEVTSYDPDSFNCEGCDATWPTGASADGAWNEPDAERCPSTHYHEYLKETFRCVLTAGHMGDPFIHEYPSFIGWRAEHERPR